MTQPNKPKVLYAKEDHSHPLEAHEHKPYAHEHSLEPHDHTHYHSDLSDSIARLSDQISALKADHAMTENSLGTFHIAFRAAVRSLLSVFEAGVTNSEQAKAIHAVRVAIGDAKGSGCPHENHARDRSDKLICTDCGLDITRLVTV